MKSNERVLRAMIREMINEDRPKIELVRVPSVGDTYRPVALPGKVAIVAAAAAAKIASFLKTGCLESTEFPIEEMSKLDASSTSPDVAIQIDLEHIAVVGYSGPPLYKLIKTFDFKEWPDDKKYWASLEEPQKQALKDFMIDVMSFKCKKFDFDLALKNIGQGNPTKSEFFGIIKDYVDYCHATFQDEVGKYSTDIASKAANTEQNVYDSLITKF